MSDGTRVAIGIERICDSKAIDLMSLKNTVRFLWNHPLSKGAFVPNLLRFMKWQVTSRLYPDAAFLLPWVGGMKLIARRGETGVTGNIYCGLHEFEEMALTVHLLRSDDLFLDAGANAGVFSLLACGVAGASGIAVEPVPATFKRLKDQVLLNSLGDRIALHQAGLGEAPGTLRFTAGLDTINHVVAEGERDDGNVVTVPITTIDKICCDRAPTLVKMDVEGYELFALKGGLETMRSPAVKGVILEVNGTGERYGISDNDLLGFMNELAFVPMTYDPWTRKLSPKTTSGKHSGNLIFVRDRSWVEARCSSSQRISIGSHQI